MFWEDITIEAYDAWMMGLQSELEAMKSLFDD